MRDCGYWNNTDPADGVSEDEWKVRRAAWSAVIDRSPAEVGLEIRHPGKMKAKAGLFK